MNIPLSKHRHAQLQIMFFETRYIRVEKSLTALQLGNEQNSTTRKK